ncbi:MAG: bifunctional phosphopantothenoylcysteine decarboxylase/phosphopantothenate--cysteine ligase CoaBC [Gammaproteobacteria bacterium]|nr:MAG: bifunctional phosphopantothenoylcysteine decarboxylase/phosphopantothenate--cysteine ligase CoaBC [Gammaproteobacteria bacterium]
MLLGITGSIAAYKSAELVRLLRKEGHEVRVVMTPAATAFITPLTFQALSGHPVRTDLLDPEQEAGMDHIHLARWAERVLIAPASADFMARIAHGLADDLLTTLCLATEAPLFVAPAMNQAMWSHPATQANARILRERGARILGPCEGPQACGEEGAGRMMEPEALAAFLREGGKLQGVRVLITAGPTREAVDPVRYLSNRSSGKMGFAIAQAAAEEGAEVILVSGPVALPTPPGIRRVDVESAGEMFDAVMDHIPQTDIFIAAAAVSDYRPARPSAQKIKKKGDTLTLSLVKNPDILGTVAALPSPPFTVGFAAETEALERHAREKLYAKGIDMIAANRVGRGLGFESEENALQLFWEGGGTTLHRQAKRLLARRLVEIIGTRYQAALPDGRS